MIVSRCLVDFLLIFSNVLSLKVKPPNTMGSDNPTVDDNWRSILYFLPGWIVILSNKGLRDQFFMTSSKFDPPPPPQDVTQKLPSLKWVPQSCVTPFINAPTC